MPNAKYWCKASRSLTHAPFKDGTQSPDGRAGRQIRFHAAWSSWIVQDRDGPGGRQGNVTRPVRKLVKADASNPNYARGLHSLRRRSAGL